MWSWRPASFTFCSANFSCSSERVMPVYLHPVCLTSSMAKVPQPQPISRTSWSLLTFAFSIIKEIFRICADLKSSSSALNTAQEYVIVSSRNREKSSLLRS
uniref:S-tetrahydroprotoberberine N-methyltransferase-like isoform X2 n=1 Tax=Rhizophora mucronata TaxID=61149 RepID=A0A2P2LGR2_RHIMU